jgi:hypothetical protein
MAFGSMISRELRKASARADAARGPQPDRQTALRFGRWVARVVFHARHPGARTW